MNQIRFACRACILAGLAAAALALGAGPVAAGPVVAACAPTVSQMAALPPSPCVPVLSRLLAAPRTWA